MRKIGVYLLMDNKTVVYVGKTENWPGRISQHPTISFTSARLFECAKSNLDVYERRFIEFFKPEHNFYGHGPRVYRKLTNEWVVTNAEYIKKSIEGKDTIGLVALARKDLKFSPRYVSTDLLNSIIREYNKHFLTDFNHKTNKFKPQKQKSGTR